MNSDFQAQDTDAGASGGGLAITDVYYVLFRRKWIAVVGVLLGALVAAGLWKLKQPLYESEAKLLVKYVVEPQAIVPLGTEVRVQNPDESGAAVLNSEIEILKSVDILQHVAGAVGSEKILPKGAATNDVDRAAGIISKRLRTVPLQKSKIIVLQFQHADPTVPQPVLHEVIEAYLKKHDAIHSSLGVSDETLFRQREDLRAALASADRELKALKDKAGVHSLEDSKKEYVKLASNVRQELFSAEAELSERRASYDILRQQQPANAPVTGPATEVPGDKIDEYRILSQQVTTLAAELTRLMGGLTAESPLVKTNQIKLQEARAKKTALETNFPALLRLATAAAPALPTALVPGGAPPSVLPALDLASQSVLVRAIESRVLTLSNQLEMARAELAKIDDVEGQITDLERRRTSLEKQLAFVEQSIAQAKFNATLGDRQNTSISKVQAPSPPSRDFGQLYKKMVMAVLGGLIVGLVLAFVVELVLDRTLKRSKDIEGILGVPVYLSIPVLHLKPLLMLGNRDGKDDGGGELPATPAAPASGSKVQASSEPPQPDHEMKPYQDALRDRLVTYFDIRDMTHKPKLIAVTGCKEGSGVSSVAAGLAASLSETGDGNVLLVHMRGQKGAAHAFSQGKPACGLAAALENETRDSAQVQDNLYVVTANSADQKLQRIIPQQFSSFVPKLKASDYDYIIFDMPPVGQTSITAKVARFMDMVLMVVESEKTDRDVAKRAGDLLAESKATVAAVLNKQRRYVPTWLQQELP